MEDIEIGEYVRTAYGQIRKIIDVEDGLYVVDRSIPFKQENVVIWAKSVKRKEITKHSENLIDLLEIGDFVNARMIGEYYGYDEDGNDIDGLGILYNEEEGTFLKLEEVKIKTILTHEQYDANCFKVEGE